MSDSTELRDRIVAALKTVYDPEIPINIHDLGLIYDLAVDDAGNAHVRMTLTTPNCPMAETIVSRVGEAVRKVQGVSEAEVELVWDPAWSPERMSDNAEFELLAMGIDPKRAAETAAQHRPTGLTLRGRKTD